ncbi:MAG: NAD(P)H nitroreductase [Enterobacteriaceae bacterium]
MEALELLLSRRSHPKLAEPKPTGKFLDNIIDAGLRAPDHGGLHPWRFIIISDEGLQRFSQLLAAGVAASGGSEEMQQKASEAPFRAPMIIAVLARCREVAKVPHWEQVASACCAVQAMQMAALAQGFGGIWRTGPLVDNPQVREGLQCEVQEQVVGLLYLGTPQAEPPRIRPLERQQFISHF